MINKLSQLIFPTITKTLDELEKQYPPRINEEVVTRFAPSPTGFLHIGGVYTALINEKIAHQKNGKFLLRLEDTDKKREVLGSKEIIVNIFNKLNIKFDEGVTLTNDLGDYSPYTQSARKEIYQIMAKHLMDKGLAYPCFCTEEELEEIHNLQENNKDMFGFYGKYAKYRDISYDEAKKLIDENKEYVVRFKSPQDKDSRITFVDLIKGEISMEANFNDVVLLKSDGIPTYHFAHACDDHFMRVTNVIRSDEWLASVPLHIELFSALGFTIPSYAHVAPVMKQDNDSRRKLSKRKDPESNAQYYLEKGYPIKAIFVYLYTLIQSNFEQWYLENKNEDLNKFEFKFSNMGVSGPLYDLEKLKNISSEIIYNISSENNLNNLLEHSKEYDLNLYNRLNSNLELTEKLINTQGENSHEKRKDLYNYSMFLDCFGLFYNDLFDNEDDLFLKDLYENVEKDKLSALATAFKDYFIEVKDGSLKTLKDLSKELNYTDKKKYEKDPSLYSGISTHFYHALRIMITHKSSGISMDDIISILGYDEVIRRISKFI